MPDDAPQAGPNDAKFPPAQPSEATTPAADADVPEDEVPSVSAATGVKQTPVGDPAAPVVLPDASAAALDYAQAASRAATPPPVTTADNSTLVRRVAVMVGVVAAVGILYFGRDLLLPIALAVLLSFLLSPACEYLERRHIPRAISVVGVILAALVVVLAIGFGLYRGLMQLGNDLDDYKNNISLKIKSLPLGGGGLFGNVQDALQDINEQVTEAAQTVTTQPATDSATESTSRPAGSPALGTVAVPQPSFAGGFGSAVAPPGAIAEARRQANLPGASAARPVMVKVVPEADSPFQRVAGVLGLAAGPLGTAGIVLVFALFILLDRDELRDRVIKLTAGQQINLATQAIDDAGTRISRYLRAQCIVNGTYGLAVGLLLAGASYVLHREVFPGIWLWALLTAVLRFIPYIGPWIGAAFPVVVSLGHWPGYDMFLVTMLTFVVIELISNNVMEPMLYGKSTGMSETAIILAATFWAFVWGPIGLLLATPLTTVVVVLGKYVPALRFFDVLLGDEPVLTPQSRLYQRLLALDAEDAGDVVEEYREEHTLTETLDDVMLPALALAERDRHAGNLTDERVAFLRKAMREILVEAGEQHEPLPSDSIDLNDPSAIDTVAKGARVVLIPAGDDADEVVAMMLKQLLDRRGYETTVLDDEELASEKLGQVFSRHADVVVVSALPPRAVAQARYLVKRLEQAQHARGERDSNTSAALIVGLWTITSDKARAAQRVGGGTGTNVRVVTTLAEAAEAVRQRAEVSARRRGAVG